MFYNIVNSFSIFVLKDFFRFRVYNKECVPKGGPFILASNHASHLDPIVLAAACPRKLSFMARHDLFLINPLFGWFIRDLGAFPVKRKTADISAFKTAITLLKNGSALVMFPEGSRQVNGILGEPESGVGMLSAKLNIPIVPAFIAGTDVVFPKGSRIIRIKRITVNFGKQIFVERRTPYQDIAHRVMQDIRQLSCPVSD